MFTPATYTRTTNPLTAALAFWHASTNTPYVERTVVRPLTLDYYTHHTGRRYYLRPLRKAVH